MNCSYKCQSCSEPMYILMIKNNMIKYLIKRSLLWALTANIIFERNTFYRPWRSTKRSHCCVRKLNDANIIVFYQSNNSLIILSTIGNERIISKTDLMFSSTYYYKMFCVMLNVPRHLRTKAAFLLFFLK